MKNSNKIKIRKQIVTVVREEKRRQEKEKRREFIHDEPYIINKSIIMAA